MMHLLKALSGFSIRRITRLALPNATALTDACIDFEGTGNLPEDAEERIKRILISFKEREAALLDRRDIRFITAAIGSSALIGLSEVSDILTEVERRRNKSLLRAVFKALLACYSELSLRSLIRSFVLRHVVEGRLGLKEGGGAAGGRQYTH
jgi:hypothetical protein